MGKGGGSIGSYIICDEIYREYLINFGREIIYTTSLPPVNTLWNLFILEKMEEFSDRRKKLWELIDFSKEKIKELGINAICDSQIMALIIGDNKKADIISKSLRDKGYVVYPIKSPTVAKGTERIRVGLNPNISKKEIFNFLKEFKNELNSIF